MNSRQQQAEQTKQRILEAAYQIVREEGIHALSSPKIIEVAGISKGGFFHHFPQIEDLYLYMLDHFIQQFDADLAPQKFNDFRAFMRATTEYTMQLLEQSPEMITTLFYFFSQGHHKPAYQQQLKTLLEAAFARWAADIARYFAPALSATQQSHIVRLLDMYFYGLSFHYLVLGDKPLYRTISDELAEMVLMYVEHGQR
ncbi:MAG: TetR/AcrR family transcriptional regulator [Caldilineaceae bacterium]